MRSIVYEGQEFKSLKSLADHLGISRNTLRKQIKENIPQRDWGKKEPLISDIEYKGKIYPTLKELADELGLQVVTLRYRVNNWDKKNWDRGTKPGLRQSNEGLTFEDKHYKSVSELAKYLGLSKNCLNRRINNGTPKDEWARPSNRSRGSVLYGNTSYPSLYDLAKHISKKSELHMVTCFNKLIEEFDKGVDIEEAVDIAINHQRKTQVEHLGDTFESYTALSRHLDIHIVTLRDRIQKGWPEEMWAAEELPTQSPDFYFAIENPEKATRPCSVYVVQLKRFEPYKKIGIAVSLTHRRDTEYGDELYLNTFSNRIEALIFEGAILCRTQDNACFPIELDQPHREDKWHGITEVRQIRWTDLELTINSLENELEEEGFEVIAQRYIPMSKAQEKLLSEALRTLQNYKPGEVDT